MSAQNADTREPFHVVYAALCGETWTEERPEWGPDWHRQFPDWKAALAARIAVEALEEAGYEVTLAHGYEPLHFDGDRDA